MGDQEHLYLNDVHLKKPQLSSSSENLSSKPSYPDISHVFREVHRDHHRPKSEFVGMSSNSWQTSEQVGNYGWVVERSGDSAINELLSDDVGFGMFTDIVPGL
jgi:hypothetical protein